MDSKPIALEFESLLTRMLEILLGILLVMLIFGVFAAPFDDEPPCNCREDDEDEWLDPHH